jgi:hypothetical protein
LRLFLSRKSFISDSDLGANQLDQVEQATRRETQGKMRPLERPVTFTQASISLPQQTTKQIYQNTFPWNDRKKPNLSSSNCFMASTKIQEREIKLKVAKDRYNVFEKARLTEVEKQQTRSS